jgi:hypothetical protein
VSAPASPRLRWITAALLLIAAVLAIALPFMSSTLLTIALGGVAIAAGISQLLRLTSVEGKRSKVFGGLSALLYLVGGISLLAFPIQSTLSLTLFLGFLLAIEGVMELAAAADRRMAPERHLGDRHDVRHRPGLLGGEPAHGAGVGHRGLRRRDPADPPPPTTPETSCYRWMRKPPTAA